MKRASGGIGGSSYSDAQQKRRQEALARQKAARRQQFVQIARIPDVVDRAACPEPAGPEPASTVSNSGETYHISGAARGAEYS
eukprot:gene3291-13315_t